jgi:hypothetical protein
MNTCGGCTFCCLTMEVEALSKPKDVWCSHCNKTKGCAIYETRPEPCRIFQCLFLQTEMDPSMRPDRTKVMFLGTQNPNVIQMVVHKQYPDVWRSGRVHKFVEHLRKKFHVIVVCGDKRFFLGGDAPTPADIAAELQKIGATYGAG